MTITSVESARLAEPVAGKYSVAISLRPADTGQFTALTGKLASLPAPRDQIAIIVGGRVIIHPQVNGVITGNDVQISGITSLARAEHLLHDLRAG
jgi:preprotein translocase subunit SecD